jgi:hypothetical protein
LRAQRSNPEAILYNRCFNKASFWIASLTLVGDAILDRVVPRGRDDGTIVTFDEMVALAQTAPSPLFNMSARGFRPVEHGVPHPAFLPTGAMTVACGNRLVA